MAFEAWTGAAAAPIYTVGGSIVVAVPSILTALGMWAVSRERGVALVIPGILAIDMLLVAANLFAEGGLESGWAATPVLLITMLPLFGHDRKQVWFLTGLLVVVYLGMFYLRSTGALPYNPRNVLTLDYAAYTGLGFLFLAVGVAVLAGRTSVDVLNSQRELEQKVDSATRALREAQAQLVQQEKMVSLGQLTAGVTHEINNPLTFVRTNVTSLDRDLGDLVELLDAYAALDERLAEIAPDELERIVDLRDDLCLDDPREVIGQLVRETLGGLDRIQHIIRDLKVFARLEDAERRPVDVREGIESTIKMLGPALENGVRVECDFQQVPVVDAYPALLNQVFMNIVQNGVEAAPDHGGRVRVVTRVEGDDGVIEVIDNGPGVPEELRGRVFDPFFTTKEVGGGTGLGLSLSYGVVERHGGRIEIEDAPGGGALFRIVLPVSA